MAWPKSEPITQMTHPLMFQYFKLKLADFYFVHMLDTTQFILFNNKEVHANLMLPWVKCALKEDCIAPRGSKFHGCDFSRRPAFLYSGCHRYEMSAFSIITALMFNFDQTKYTLWDEGKTNQSSIISTSTNSETETSADIDSFMRRIYENSFMASASATKPNDLERKIKRQQNSVLLSHKRN